MRVVLASLLLACSAPARVPAPRSAPPTPAPTPWGETMEVETVLGRTIEAPLECTGELCWLHPRPRPLAFRVGGTGPDNVFLFGDEIRRFDGRTWQRLEGCDGVHAMWASAPDDVWFVVLNDVDPEEHGLPIDAACHYDGHTLQRFALPYPAPMLAIHGTARDDVWLVGGSPHGEQGDVGPWNVIFHFDGTRWRDVRTPRLSGLQITDVWGARDDVYFSATLEVLRWDGRRLRMLPEAEGEAIEDERDERAVRELRAHRRYEAAPNDVYEVDDLGAVRHFDGREWTPVSEIEALFGGEVDDLWAGAANDISVLGHDRTSAWLARFDGTRWRVSRMPEGTPSILRALPDGSLLSMGDGLWHVDGDRWERASEPRGITSAWIAGDAVYALASAGLFRLEPGRVEHIRDTGVYSDGCARGEEQLLIRTRHGESAFFDGTTWTEDEENVVLYHVYCLEDAFYRVSSAGLERRVDGAWRDLAYPHPSIPSDLAASGRTIVTASPYGLARYDGSAWTTIEGAATDIALAPDGTIVTAQGGVGPVGVRILRAN